MRVSRRTMLPLTVAAAVSASSRASVAGTEQSGACTPSDEANAEAARRWVEEVYANGNVDYLDEIVAPSFPTENPNSVADLAGLKIQAKATIDQFKMVIPNVTYTVDETISIGGRVALRGTIAGTSIRGKKVEAMFLDILVVEDGKIAAIWPLVDVQAISAAL